MDFVYAKPPPPKLVLVHFLIYRSFTFLNSNSCKKSEKNKESFLRSFLCYERMGKQSQIHGVFMLTLVSRKKKKWQFHGKFCNEKT